MGYFQEKVAAQQKIAEKKQVLSAI